MPQSNSHASKLCLQCYIGYLYESLHHKIHKHALFLQCDLVSSPASALHSRDYAHSWTNWPDPPGSTILTFPWRDTKSIRFLYNLLISSVHKRCPHLRPPYLLRDTSTTRRRTPLKLERTPGKGKAMLLFDQHAAPTRFCPLRCCCGNRCCGKLAYAKFYAFYQVAQRVYLADANHRCSSSSDESRECDSCRFRRNELFRLSGERDESERDSYWCGLRTQ